MKYSTTGNKTLTSGDVDQRYTVRVYLIRDGRPKYWEFHCVYCGTKVSELNGDVSYMTDVTQDSPNASNRVRCNGKFCRMWYEFSLSK